MARRIRTRSQGPPADESMPAQNETSRAARARARAQTREARQAPAELLRTSASRTNTPSATVAPTTAGEETNLAQDHVVALDSPLSSRE